MVDIDAAIGFVVARGDALDRARLSRLRTGAAPAPEAFDPVERGQLDSGGWPMKPGEPIASIDATCFQLAELDELSGLSRPAAARALRWLVGRQRVDGCWEEDALLAPDAPPWAAPGDPEARFYLTASVAFWLAVADADAQAQGQHRPYQASLERAADALRDQIDDSGGWPGFLMSGWLAGAVLQRVGHFYEAARVFVVLHDRVSSMSPADAAALAVALRRLGVSDDALLAAARERLTRTQRPDGSWPGDGDPLLDVHTTLTALHALS